MYRLMIFFVLLTPFYLHAQCPTVDFDVGDNVCEGENIDASNNSTGGSNFYWDFCSGDLAETSTSESISSSSRINRGRSVRLIELDGNWYGFTIDQATNRLTRFDFGESLKNAPSLVEVDLIGDPLQGAYDFQLLKEGSSVFGVVANTSGSNLLLLNWGEDITSEPVSSIVSNLAILSQPNAIFLMNEGNVLYGLVSEGADESIIRFSFGSSIANDPQDVSKFLISGASNPRGIGIIKDCDRYVGLVTSYSNNRVYSIDFGTSLANPPAFSQLTIFSGYSFPASLQIDLEGGSYYGFIQSALGDMYKLSFGESISDFFGTGENLGDFGLANNFALDLVNESSRWWAFTIELDNPETSGKGNLVRYTFPDDCEASAVTSVEETPSSKYLTSGSHKITLDVTDANGNVSSSTQTITVSPSTAPTISLTASPNQCLTNPIDFTHTSDQNLVSFDWNFGDGVGTSSDPDPSYTYSSTGTYTVRLTVESENGCGQFIEEEVTIYNPPVASFTVPGGLLCSNNPIAFTNTSTFDPGSPTTWAWDFGDGSAISTEQAPTYSYPAPGDYTVKLTATLPTCTSEFTVPVSIEEGPLTDYTFENVCDGNEVVFTDLSSGISPITSWSWDFGDGGNSSVQSPQHLYASPGDYQVTLTTANQLGCSTFSTQIVTVHSNPVAAFSNGDVCARAETVFTDNSTVDNANITSWLWDFGDGNISTDQHPVHIFSSEGDYDVKLKVTTNFGCADSLTVNTSVAPSATVAFSYDQACLGLPTQFINETTTDPSNPVTNTTWIIDGKVFNEQNPSYEFPQQGIYLVSLTVSTQNLCLVTYEEEISVNPEPTPTFGYTQSCGNGPVTFFDTTIAFDGDPIITRSWQIDGNVFANDSVVQVTPDSTGLYKVSLIITTENGCMVSTLENVNVLDAPKAGFATATSIGAYPFQLDFHNTSVAGENYAWMFDADTVQSTAENPTHTFTAEGDYEVLLVTSNSLGCSDTTTQVISAVQPVYDAELQDINTVENGEKLQFFLSISNNGSIELNETNLEIRVQLGPDVAFTEPFDETLYAFQSTDYPLVFQLDTNHSVPFICAELVPIEYEAPATASCLNFSTKPIFSTPYPNPATDWVTTGISIPAPAPIYLTWMDSNGKVFFDREISDTREGYNEISFEVTTYMAGSYFLNIRYLESSKTFKVVKR